MPNKRGRGTVQAPASAGSAGDVNRQFALGLVQAFGGAVLFSCPMLMTMEMWSLGFYMDPLRLALYIALDIPLLFGLSYYAGFEPTPRHLEDVLDAFTAYAVGFVVSASMLVLLAIIGPGMSADEVVGKIVVQAAPAGMGAMLVRSQFGESPRKEEKRRGARYAGGLFLMVVGALYLSSSLAATEEIVLISYMMTPLHAVALLVVSLLVMHGFIRAAVARGKLPIDPNDAPFWPVFLRFTVVGYGIALAIGGFILWTFGRMDGLAVEHAVQSTVVLGFPAALGAGTARLIL